MNTDQIITALRTPPHNAYVARKPGGGAALTLAWAPVHQRYRYHKGSLAGGGGRKRATCDETTARALIEKYPGGTIDRR